MKQDVRQTRQLQTHSIDYHLRSASQSDRKFLYALHCRTMRGVIEATWGWDDPWQRTDFDRRFAAYLVSIIEAKDRAVGSLWLEWKPDSLYIHEVQIAPEFQGRGLGTAVIQDTITQGARRTLPVMLSVVPANPRAKQLYERLGFEVTQVDPPFIRMRHNARIA